MTWETVETWDIGFDLAAFNNRLTATFDWYRRTTKEYDWSCSGIGFHAGN